MNGRLENEKKIGIMSPGPGAYAIKDPKIEDKRQAFSFPKDQRGKEENVKKIPGPGEYDSRNAQILQKCSPSWG